MSVCISGGFDPPHHGHALYIMEAGKHGHVTVILNSDDWLMRKKGYIFMPWDQRATILGSFKGVVDVVHVDDADETVCDALRRIRPTYFAKGGDRTADNTPEVELCGHLGIECLWNVGGRKVASSSEIVQRIRETDHA